MAYVHPLHITLTLTLKNPLTLTLKLPCFSFSNGFYSFLSLCPSLQLPWIHDCQTPPYKPSSQPCRPSHPPHQTPRIHALLPSCRRQVRTPIPNHPTYELVKGDWIRGWRSMGCRVRAERQRISGGFFINIIIKVKLCKCHIS